MIEIEENQFVLYSYKESKLQQVQFIDNTINIRKEVDEIYAWDIAVTQDCHILLLIGWDLYCLTDNGKLMKLPLKTAYQYIDDLLCIHVNNENQIIVGSKLDTYTDEKEECLA